MSIPVYEKNWAREHFAILSPREAYDIRNMKLSSSMTDPIEDGRTLTLDSNGDIILTGITPPVHGPLFLCMYDSRMTPSGYNEVSGLNVDLYDGMISVIVPHGQLMIATKWYDDSTTYAIGDAVMMKEGIWHKVTAPDTQPVHGIVLDVSTVSGDAIVIQWKGVIA